MQDLQELGRGGMQGLHPLPTPGGPLQGGAQQAGRQGGVPALGRRHSFLPHRQQRRRGHQVAPRLPAQPQVEQAQGLPGHPGSPVGAQVVAEHGVHQAQPAQQVQGGHRFGAAQHAIHLSAHPLPADLLLQGRRYLCMGVMLGGNTL